MEQITIEIAPWYVVNEEIKRTILAFFNDSEGPALSFPRRLTEQLMANEDFKLSHRWFLKSYKIVTEKRSQDVLRQVSPIIDPLQIFLSYGMSSLHNEERVRRVNSILSALNSPRTYLNINFDGMPKPMGARAIAFKSFGDAMRLWEYVSTLIDSHKKVTLRVIDRATRVFGVDVVLLSILSFGIRPHNVIPVDRWTMDYINQLNTGLENRVKKNARLLFYKINFQQSPEVIVNIARADSIIQLVSDAPFAETRETTTNEESKEEKSINNNENPKTVHQYPTNSKKYFSGNYQILAIQVLNDNDLLPILRKGELYKFIQTFEIPNPNFENDLSNVLGYGIGGQLGITISAIVGKNGSGKSSLIDLIHIMAYNLSLKFGLVTLDVDDIELKPINNIDFDLYYNLNGIYRLNSITLDTALFWNAEAKKWDEETVDKEFLETFFYTVSINYSIYSLNSNSYNIDFDWLSSLMHKNDNYQSPIVITPQRTKGNFDINKEIALTKQRLFLNLIELDKTDQEQDAFTFSDILGYDKKFTHISITNASKKMRAIASGLEKSSIESKKNQDFLDLEVYSFLFNQSNSTKWEELLKSVFVVFNVPIAKLTISKERKIYLLHKLFTMSLRYFKNDNITKLLSNFNNERINIAEKEFSDFIEQIYWNNTHITDKFKQAIFFIKNEESLNHFYSIGQKSSLKEVNEYLLQLNQVHWSELRDISVRKAQPIISESQSIKYLAVPPFFEYDFLCAEKISYNSFSSGEKQFINSISNITYHISNLNSNGQPGQAHITYNNVNLILDEIELYFHPEYQKRFIYILTSVISKLPIEHLKNLNIIISTHSPFILSDIPSNSVLKLENGVVLPVDQINSFAANIHDLLKDEFFLMGGSIGDFAKKYINEIINDLEKFNNDSSNDKENIKRRIEIIGEPLIRHSLFELWGKKFAMPTYETLLEIYNQQNQNVSNQH